MAGKSKVPKPLSAYQMEYNKREPRERWCGRVHGNIADAIVHAETNLGMYGKPAQPYWGRTRFTGSTVVGWQVTDAKRYRLDFTPDYAALNAEAST